jgi:hypothetical protein
VCVDVLRRSNPPNVRGAVVVFRFVHSFNLDIFAAAVCAVLLGQSKNTTGMRVHNETYHAELSGELLEWAVYARKRMVANEIAAWIAARKQNWAQPQLDRCAAMMVCC